MKKNILFRILDAINDTGGCWEWQGGRLKAGYGKIRIGEKHELVHRLMWEIHNNATIPDGMVVMHKCDNPCCCNPTHLQLGTHADNSHDMWNKGRGVSVGLSGEVNPNVTLTEEAVAKIRKSYVGRQHHTLPKTGPTMKELAQKFGVSITQINRILKGESWSNP